MVTRRIALISLGIGAALIVVSLLLWQQTTRRNEVPDIPGLLWPEPLPLTAFTLEDQRRQRFDLARLQGKWTFLFFGYTNCPDVCPTTLSVLAGVEKRLQATPAGHKNTQFVFVSLDPMRDTPERLGRYVAYFNKGFLGVTGSRQNLSALTRQLGIFYELGEPDADGNYVVSHSRAIMLADPESRLIALFSAPHDAAEITDRYRRIRSFLGG